MAEQVVSIALEVPTREDARRLKSIMAEKTPESWLVAADYCEDQGMTNQSARLRSAGVLMDFVGNLLDTSKPHGGVRTGEVKLNGIAYRYSLWGGGKAICFDLQRWIVYHADEHGPARPEPGGCWVYECGVQLMRHYWLTRPDYRMKRLRDIAAQCGYETSLFR